MRKTERGTNGFGSSGVSVPTFAWDKCFPTETWEYFFENINDNVFIIPSGERFRQKFKLVPVTNCIAWDRKETFLEMLELHAAAGDFFQSQLAVDKIFFFCLTTKDIVNVACRFTIYPASYEYIYENKVCIDVIFESDREFEKSIKHHD